MRNWLKKFEEIFAAVTFAEADCPELAQEFIGKETVTENAQSLDAFLETVGLKNVQVCYVVAQV